MSARSALAVTFTSIAKRPQRWPEREEEGGGDSVRDMDSRGAGTGNCGG